MMVRHLPARRRRRLARSGVVVLLAGLVGLVVWLLGFSGNFAVSHVDVTGTAWLSADDVRAAAEITIGQPLITLNQSQISDRVTEALPVVESVSIKRHWSGTVEIKVKERTAVFKVPVGLQYGLVSADGTVFRIGADEPSVLLARAPIGQPTLLANVATVVAAIPDDLTPHVQSVSASTRDSITLHLDEGRQVIWGSAEQSALKAQVIMVLLTQPGHTYDISAPSSPAVR